MEPESTLEIFRGGTRDGLETNLGEDQGSEMTGHKNTIKGQKRSYFP